MSDDMPLVMLLVFLCALAFLLQYDFETYKYVAFVVIFIGMLIIDQSQGIF